MNPLQLIEDPLRWLLDRLHENVGLTYGWSIVVLTVLVRLVLIPLVVRQYTSMRQMQAIAPKIKELQRKYKGNRQKLQEEMMRTYQEHGVNPFSSCLPLVAQLPIFFALYYVLRGFSQSAADGTSLSFMWVIPDITLQLTEIGWGAAVIVAIYAISQLLSTELSLTPNISDVQRRIMRILPLFIVLFIFQFPVPSGLVLYWVTTNLWTTGQQLIMRHRIGLHLAREEEVGPAPAPAAAIVADTDDVPVEEGDERARAGKRARRAPRPKEEAPPAPALDAESPNGEVQDELPVPEPSESRRDAGPRRGAAGRRRPREVGSRPAPRSKGKSRRRQPKKRSK